MTTTEARVLRALAPGGQFTAGQIARELDISNRRASRAATSLSRKGFTVGRTGPRHDAWCIAPRGVLYVTTCRGKTAIDVPAGVRW